MAQSRRRSSKAKPPPAVERALASGNPLHFVLRASGGPGSIDTHKEHDLILQEVGSVWLGKWGASVGAWPVEVASKQIASRVPTFLYLRTNPRTTHKGILRGVAGPGLAPDLKRVPEYYRHERCGLWFLVMGWEPIDEEELDRLRSFLEQRSSPVYSGQRGLFFVTLPR